MQQNNGQSSMSNYKNSKKMKAGASDRDSNDNDMFPDQFSTPPNNAMITACSRTTLVNRLDRPQPQGSSSRVNVDDGNYIDPYFRGMEPGIRFFPLDQELVVEYLMKKIRNEPLPKNRIHELNDCILCRIYLKGGKPKAEPMKTGKKSRNDGNPVCHGPAGSRNDASTSYNDSSQQPATHAASTSDTMEVYFNGIQPCYDYNMNRRCFGGNSNQIAAMMEPAMYTLPTNEGTGRGFSQRVAFAVPSSSMPSTMNFAGLNGPSSSMPLTMHGAGFMSGPSSSMPLTMHGGGFMSGPSSSMPLTMLAAGLNEPHSTMHLAALNGPSSSMPLTMLAAGLNEPHSTMHLAALNGPSSSSMPLTMHDAGLNGPISSMPPATLPVDNMEGNDHLVEPNNDNQFNNHQELNDDLRNSLPDSAFRDDAMARIHEMWVSSNSRREG
uniref:Uncharacterized protein n=1 Tax=Populus alba TaxID=43335 RepID=A0A4U5NKT7_POPAL|nr:hypothetical protein D5086_0000261210 [Populus alba]